VWVLLHFINVDFRAILNHAVLSFAACAKI